MNLPDNNERFLFELEFVQLLSNAKYLTYLAQNNYLQDESFLQFLQYLQYWKSPQYAKYLVFPHCLAFLDALIEIPSFRECLKLPAYTEYIHQQQGIHWLVGASVEDSSDNKFSIQ